MKNTGMGIWQDRNSLMRQVLVSKLNITRPRREVTQVYETQVLRLQITEIYGEIW